MNKFDSPSPKYALCQVWFKLAKWFWRKRFLNILNRNLLFRDYIPLEKGVALHLNKLESPSPKDALCQVWFKLAKWFWRRRFLNIFNIFYSFRYYLPLEKGVALHLNKLESPPLKDALCQVWFEIGPVVLEKKLKMCKRQTRGDQKSSLELSAQVSEKGRSPFQRGTTYIKSGRNMSGCI